MARYRTIKSTHHFNSIRQFHAVIRLLRLYLSNLTRNLGRRWKILLPRSKSNYNACVCTRDEASKPGHVLFFAKWILRHANGRKGGILGSIIDPSLPRIGKAYKPFLRIQSLEARPIYDWMQRYNDIYSRWKTRYDD